MTLRGASLNVALGLGITAQQIFAVAVPLPTKVPSKQSKKMHAAIVVSKPPVPASGYFAQIQDNLTQPVAPTVLINASSNPRYADEQGTAASHIKVLSVLAVFRELEKNPGFADIVDPACRCSNWELARRAWISSDNTAVQILVNQIAPVHTNEGVKIFLNNLAEEIGLSKKFRAENASGNPDFPVKHGRADSLSTPSDEERIGFELAKHKDLLAKLARSAGTVRTDTPTNGLFYPLTNRKDPDDGYVLICKTGTDNYQNHSTLWILMTPDNKVLVGHHRHPKNEAAPIAAAAQFIMNAMDKAGIDNPRLRGRLEQFASQKMAPTDVGAKAGFLHVVKRVYNFSAPPPRPIQFASVSKDQAPKIHRKPRLPRANPANVASILAFKMP